MITPIEKEGIIILFISAGEIEEILFLLIIELTAETVFGLGQSRDFLDIVLLLLFPLFLFFYVIGKKVRVLGIVLPRRLPPMIVPLSWQSRKK